MRRNRSILAAALLCASLSCDAQQGAHATTRIITLAPHLTELVYAVGAGDRLVGVSSFSDYPPEAAALPVIGDNGRIDIERVLRLRPDLVLAWRSGMNSSQWRELARRGIPVLVSDAETLEDVPRLLREFGRSFGDPRRAEAAAVAYERDIEALRLRYAGAKRVRSFVEIWPAPLMTVNGRHVISKVVHLCGGTNVYGQLASLTPVVSAEQLYKTQPALILSSVSGGDPLERWKRFPGLEAVRSGRVRSVDAALLTRMGPRLPEAAARVCAHIESAR
jgi:iron complex transport system substrate-binding protein